MKDRSVCIIGGAGWVGRHICAKLVAQGTRVTVVTRNAERAKHLLVLPTVEVVEPAGFDAKGLAPVFQGHGAIVNLAGILHERSPGGFDRTHLDLPRAVVAAMKQGGVARLLHMSALGADTRGPSRYLQTKGEGEFVVTRAGRESGLAVTVFRPSIIFGRGDGFLTLFARLVRTLPVVPLARAEWRVQPVWVGDVARAFTLSLDLPATVGRSYNLCGPTVYSLAEIVKAVARAQALTRRVIPLPSQLAELQARVMELLPGPIMTRDNLASLSRDSVCDAVFPADFGFAPTSLETIMPEYIRPSDVDEHGLHRRMAGR